MQIVIDIPDTYYEYCKAQEDAIEIQLAVKNGTPLDEIRFQIIALPKASFWSDENDDAISREDVLEILNDYNTSKSKEIWDERTQYTL